MPTDNSLKSSKRLAIRYFSCEKTKTSGTHTINVQHVLYIFFSLIRPELMEAETKNKTLLYQMVRFIIFIFESAENKKSIVLPKRLVPYL